MGKTTGIEWCDATWNPWRGCRRVSAGCANCYALRGMQRWRLGTAVTRQRTFSDPLKWKRGKAALPHGSRIFVCSWSDFFIPQADRMRPAALKIIEQCPEWEFLLLTKRPERIHRLGFVLPDNARLGVSIENQQQVTARSMELYMANLKGCFASVEPMLGPVNLREDFATGLYSWVICGGETGPGARPMREAWVLDLEEQCRAHGVPFFFKKWGDAIAPRDGGNTGDLIMGAPHREFPVSLHQSASGGDRA